MKKLCWVHLKMIEMNDTIINDFRELWLHFGNAGRSKWKTCSLKVSGNTLKNERKRCTTLPACNAGTAETSAQNESIAEETMERQIAPWFVERTAGVFLKNRKMQAKSIPFVESRSVWQTIRPLMPKGRCNLSPRGGSVLFISECLVRRRTLGLWQGMRWTLALWDETQ